MARCAGGLRNDVRAHPRGVGFNSGCVRTTIRGEGLERSGWFGLRFECAPTSKDMAGAVASC